MPPRDPSDPATLPTLPLLPSRHSFLIEPPLPVRNKKGTPVTENCRTTQTRPGPTARRRLRSGAHGAAAPLFCRALLHRELPCARAAGARPCATLRTPQSAGVGPRSPQAPSVGARAAPPGGRATCAGALAVLASALVVFVQGRRGVAVLAPASGRWAERLPEPLPQLLQPSAASGGRLSFAAARRRRAFSLWWRACLTALCSCWFCRGDIRVQCGKSLMQSSLPPQT